MDVCGAKAETDSQEVAGGGLGEEELEHRPLLVEVSARRHTQSIEHALRDLPYPTDLE